MEIRPAVPGDIPEIMKIVADAQEFLRINGVDQWTNGYPDESFYLEDMEQKGCYAAVEDGRLAGVATLLFKPEPEYPRIEEGHWLTSDNALYGVVHRSAVSDDFRGRGIFKGFMDFFQRQCREKGAESLRVDTHRDNAVMRSALLKLGFTYCGRVEIKYKPGYSAQWVAYEKLM